MADVDFLLIFLMDRIGVAVDKGVAADEVSWQQTKKEEVWQAAYSQLAQALYNIIQADCRSDDGPTLGVAMDLKQK